MVGMDPRGKEDTLSRTPEIEKIFKELEAAHPYRAFDFRRENEMSESPVRVSGVQRSQEYTEPKAPSVTQQNVAFLEECINNLFKKVELLGIRLENVLTEGSPETASDRRGFGGNSPLSEQLAVFCRRLEDLNDRLSYLTARIDL